MAHLKNNAGDNEQCRTPVTLNSRSANCMICKIQFR